MASLLDYGVPSESIELGGGKIEVFGISGEGFLDLFRRFPVLQKMLTGQTFDVDNLLKIGGEALAAVLAAGCGYPGDANAEAIARKLSIDAQARLLKGILKITMPKGAHAFMETLNELRALLSEPAPARAPSATVPGMKSRKQSTS